MKLDRLNQLVKISLLGLALLTLSGCGHALSALKASPAPDSGFLGALGEDAAESNQFPFHRVWQASHSGDALRAATQVYVAPIELGFLRNESLLYSADSMDERAIFEKDAAKISTYLRDAFKRRLQERGGDRIIVLDRPDPHALTLRLALVELTPTDVARTYIGTALGAVIPGGGVFSISSQGTVAVEGVLYNKGGSDPLFAFADRESGKLAPVNLNDFTLYSHARAVIDEWADQYAEIVLQYGEVKVADSLPVTLLPI